MVTPRRRAWLVPALALTLASCVPEIADDVVCDGERIAVDSSSAMVDALERAQPGDCVVVRSGEYTAPFAVGEGITLVGEKEGEAVIKGGEADVAVRLSGERSALIDISVAQGVGVGVALLAPAISLRRVEVDSFEQGAVGIRCQDAGCARPEGRIELSSVSAQNSRFGVGIAGGQVLLTGSNTVANNGTGLTSGVGLFATAGAELEIQGGEVANNDIGVVLDGADTRANLNDVAVRSNEDRGVWAQGLRGTPEAPALIVGGGASIEDNGYVGLGAIDSVGVSVTGAAITGTRLKPVSTSLGQVEEIGDGIGLFEGSAQVLVEQTTLSGNGRAQGLVDRAGTGVRFADSNTVSTGAGAHLIVVQNSTEAVTVPPAQLSTPAELPLRSDPDVSLPDLEALVTE